MSGTEIVASDDPGDTLIRAGTFLRSAPVDSNLVLSLLEERVARPEPGRYWTAGEGDEIVGLVFQSPLSFHAAVTPMPAGAVASLVHVISEAAPDLPGVFGPADTASRFAGCWAEALNVAASPVEGQRLYELGALEPPTGVPGRLRRAVADDEELIWAWLEGFGHDTGGVTPPRQTIRHRIADGSVRLWEKGAPVAMAMFTPPVAGVSRIGLVYTPPDRRRRGFAGACTAATTAAALEAGADTCVLYTQLTNPQSNAIYRHIGYRVVAEQIRYAFTATGR